MAKLSVTGTNCCQLRIFDSHSWLNAFYLYVSTPFAPCRRRQSQSWLFGNLCLKEKKEEERKGKEKKNIVKRKERGKQGRRLNSLGIQRVGSIVGGKTGFMEKESPKRGINSTKKKDSCNRLQKSLTINFGSFWIIKMNIRDVCLFYITWIKKLEMKNRSVVWIRENWNNCTE